ncbi:glycosyl transferase [Rickettsia amblyommatis]|nr:glycosyl transferase [Rickettsia amblyommatis]
MFIISIIIICLSLLFIFLKTYQIGSTPLEEKDIKIFIVNLDRSTDRYNNISKQCDNNNLFYERFSTVDGYNLSITDAGGKRFTGLDVKNNPALLSLDNGYTVLCPSENINYYSDSKILNHTLTAGELGCYCSHREIWLKMVKDNIPYALIIEDDAILNDDFRNKLLTMLKHLPTDRDLIYLSLSHSKNKIFYNIYNNPYLKKIGHGGYFNTTTGYLIHLKAAQKFLEYSKNFTLEIDNVMYQAFMHSEVQSYVTSPFLIHATPNSEDSIIFEMGSAH